MPKHSMRPPVSLPTTTLLKCGLCSGRVLPASRRCGGSRRFLHASVVLGKGDLGSKPIRWADGNPVQPGSGLGREAKERWRSAGRFRRSSPLGPSRYESSGHSTTQGSGSGPGSGSVLRFESVEAAGISMDKDAVTASIPSGGPVRYFRMNAVPAPLANRRVRGNPNTRSIMVAGFESLWSLLQGAGSGSMVLFLQAGRGVAG